MKHNLPTDARLEDFANKLKELKDRLKATQGKHQAYLANLTSRVTEVLELMQMTIPPTFAISASEIMTMAVSCNP